MIRLEGIEVIQHEEMRFGMAERQREQDVHDIAMMMIAGATEDEIDACMAVRKPGIDVLIRAEGYAAGYRAALWRAENAT